ncbi:hypothetical protein C7212DRAFT_366032 [Tuber magnatum]|uniref:Uncharacterized protein n=1 Tax=Tuber magnatum TaxID=42249 RepID=A0A317SG21_9PEZI|nr:hypothetical protein C7212DRAFT_366032 [Tuber magnatum]
MYHSTWNRSVAGPIDETPVRERCRSYPAVLLGVLVRFIRVPLDGGSCPFVDGQVPGLCLTLVSSPMGFFGMVIGRSLLFAAYSWYGLPRERARTGCQCPAPNQHKFSNFLHITATS